jgi:hypothetical protein
LKTFYASYGWEPHLAAHISVPATLKDSAAGLPEARPLFASDLPELCAIDEKLVRQSMKKAALNGDKTMVAMLPNVQTMRWHHAREDFVGNELHGKVPDIKGAIVGEEPGKRVWCYWTRMWYNENPEKSDGNTLHLLRLVDEHTGIVDWQMGSLKAEDMARVTPAIAAILALAQREAAKWKMEGVEIWTPNAATVEAAKMLCPESSVVHRDGESIPSMKWYGTRESQGDLHEEVIWIGNEKYCWC